MMCRKWRFPSKTPQKSQRPFYKKVESKYLGTCKLLDQKVSLEGSQPQTVNTLRAAVYQVSLFTRVGFLKATVIAPLSSFHCLEWLSFPKFIDVKSSTEI